MFNKKEKKEKKEPWEGDKTILDQILGTLDVARKSKGYLVCVSNLYDDEKGEEKLLHNVFKVRFKGDDIPISLLEYENQLKSSEVETDEIPLLENNDEKVV